MKVSLKNIIVPSIPLAVLMVIGCILLWFSAYWGGRNSSLTAQSITLANNIPSTINSNLLLSNIVNIAFTLLNAFLLAQINNRFTIIRTRTFLPVVVFLFLMSTWNETHISIGSNFALTIIIFALFYFFGMTKDRKASEEAFMGSFLVSLSSLIINPIIFLLPVCWIGFMMFQSFSLRTFLASLLGAIAPWILLISGEYLFFNQVEWTHIFNVSPNFIFNISTVSLPILIYSGALIAIIIISIFGMFSLSNGDAIQTRNKLNFLLVLLISTFVLAVLFQQQFSLFLPLIAMVYALILSHPFTLRQNNFYGISFAIFSVFNIAYVISKYIQF